MTLTLFDTHAHLNVNSFEQTVDEVVQRAKAAGLVGINVIGIDVATSRRACDLAAQYPGLSVCGRRHPAEFSRGGQAG